MSGWIALAVLAAGAVGLLALLRLPRSLWAFAAAAIALGAAGYAWQGRPGVEAHPVVAGSTPGEVDPEITKLREDMFGRFNLEDSYYVASDAMTRAGSPDYAAQVMIGAVRSYPKDAALWTGLGIKIAAQDGNIVSPASRFAFDRAMTLAPLHPGPPFFLGLSYLHANDFASTRTFWAKALALTPPQAPYREKIGKWLAVVDQIILIQAARAKKAASQPR